MFSLRDKLTGIKLGNNTFQDLIDNRWQHPFVIIFTELAIDGWKTGYIGSRKYTASDVNHLQV